jgi:hypothetical protein
MHEKGGDKHGEIAEWVSSTTCEQIYTRQHGRQPTGARYVEHHLGTVPPQSHRTELELIFGVTPGPQLKPLPQIAYPTLR